MYVCVCVRTYVHLTRRSHSQHHANMYSWRCSGLIDSHQHALWPNHPLSTFHAWPSQVQDMGNNYNPSVWNSGGDNWNKDEWTNPTCSCTSLHIKIILSRFVFEAQVKLCMFISYTFGSTGSLHPTCHLFAFKNMYVWMSHIRTCGCLMWRAVVKSNTAHVSIHKHTTDNHFCHFKVDHWPQSGSQKTRHRWSS